jgi:MoaA/NifB/PqqE/SkfB family radical SAM enzyme
MKQNSKSGNPQGGRKEALGIEVTNRCNSLCSHCFVRAASTERSSLPLDSVKNIISEGHDLNYRHLHLTGGEPLLWDGLWEALNFASDIGYQTIFLNTNGTQVTEEICRHLASYRGLSISVSLEGPEALHDSIRGEGSYRRAVNGIEKMIDSGINLFIFTTVRKRLIPDLLKFAHETYKSYSKIYYLTLIQLIRVSDDTFDLSKDLLEPRDFLQLVKTAAILNLCGFRTYILSNPLAGVASKLLEVPWIPRSHPLYGDGSIFVKANGDISLSHSSHSSFGKYEPGMFSKVLVSEAYLNSMAPDTVTCPACKYTELCRENGMKRPSEWYRDMYPERPYCKRVLDQATLSPYAWSLNDKMGQTYAGKTAIGR